MHEFCTLPGVVEDVTDIVLNFKQVLLKMYTRGPKKLRLRVKGLGEVDGREHRDRRHGRGPQSRPAHRDAGQEISRFDAEVEVTIGRGYCPADWNKRKTRKSA